MSLQLPKVSQKETRKDAANRLKQKSKIALAGNRKSCQGKKNISAPFSAAAISGPAIVSIIS
jgi:hypothetical protein